jgi:phosphomannomutase
MNRDIFGAYDIRGIFDVDFAPEDFYQIARGYAALFQPRTVALGYDVRKSSPQLWRMVADGLIDSGVDVLNLGQISTDMLYFAVVQYRTDGGIIISASHNPAEYNGLKLIRQNAIPISQDNGLIELRDETERRCRARSTPTRRRGGIKSISFIDAYLVHIRSFIDWQNNTKCFRRVCRNGSRNGLRFRTP